MKLREPSRDWNVYFSLRRKKVCLCLSTMPVGVIDSVNRDRGLEIGSHAEPCNFLRLGDRVVETSRIATDGSTQEGNLLYQNPLVRGRLDDWVGGGGYDWLLVSGLPLLFFGVEPVVRLAIAPDIQRHPSA